jgi:hypothetical protein
MSIGQRMNPRPLPMPPHPHQRKSHRMPRTTTLSTAASVAGTAALLLFAVTACGGAAGSTNAATPSANSPQQNQSAPPAGPARFPGASGKVAAISGSTLQVQSVQSGQVAVTYTDGTTFTKTVSAAAGAITVGSCVVVRGDAAASAASGPVTAVSVQVSPAVDGACAVGGMAGGRPMGPGGTPPSGRPGGGQGAGPGGGQGADGGGQLAGRPTAGKVTAVHGSTITVAAVAFAGPGGGSAGGTASPSATPSTSPVTVTTTASTTYTKTVSGSASDLAVGQCVTALGKADDTGALTASSIASQPAVDGECSAGFGAGRSTTSGTQ